MCKLNYLSGLKIIPLHAGRITEKQGGKDGFGEVLMSWRERIPSQIPVLNPSQYHGSEKPGEHRGEQRLLTLCL